MGVAWVDTRRSIYLKGCALCRRFLSSSGLSFGGLGASILTFWTAILAPLDHAGGPWEQQDRFEMAVYRILLDSAVFLGPVYISLLCAKTLIFHYFSWACFQVFFDPYVWDFQIKVFASKVLQTSTFR